jgi:hypothetical protein
LISPDFSKVEKLNCDFKLPRKGEQENPIKEAASISLKNANMPSAKLKLLPLLSSAQWGDTVLERLVCSAIRIF